MKRKAFVLVAAVIIIIAIPLWLMLVSCSNQPIPPELAGNWTGSGKVAVRTGSIFSSFQFFPCDSTLPFQIQIDSNGKVSGAIGDASFENCFATLNRGKIGKAINIKTDYIIRGQLTGKIFNEDPLEQKEISMPFNMVNGKIDGSLFMKLNGVYPMAAIHLTK